MKLICPKCGPIDNPHESIKLEGACPATWGLLEIRGDALVFSASPTIGPPMSGQVIVHDPCGTTLAWPHGSWDEYE